MFKRFGCVGLFLFGLTSCLAGSKDVGVLVIAHGSHSSGHGHDHGGGEKSPWDKTVEELFAQAALKLASPSAIALTMMDTELFQAKVDELVRRGAKEIRVIPLFVSSHSPMVREQKYVFWNGELENGGHDDAPIRIRIPDGLEKITYETALDDAEELSGILTDRAHELSENPEKEELILVAHGPITDEDDALWISDMKKHGGFISKEFEKGGHPFALVDTLTVRDDASPDVRDEMTRRLRKKVEDSLARGHMPLILPILMAPGGIESGILKRLDGLLYRYQGHMIAPDPRLTDWIVRKASE